MAATIISQYKSKGQAPDDMDAAAHVNANSNAFKHPNSMNIAVAKIYRDYQATLRKNNSLDFDDLLVFGVKLFRGHKRVLEWCRHVLVDEL
jgi:DNA helicase II / ATP-dependent DNA helicase PcrA